MPAVLCLKIKKKKKVKYLKDCASNATYTLENLKIKRKKEELCHLALCGHQPDGSGMIRVSLGNIVFICYLWRA